jgi:hypothetical protein
MLKKVGHRQRLSLSIPNRFDFRSLLLVLGTETNCSHAPFFVIRAKRPSNQRGDIRNKKFGDFEKLVTLEIGTVTHSTKELVR